MDEGRCCGALISEYDSRDWIYEHLSRGSDGSIEVKFPKEFHVESCLYPRSQKNRGTCAAFSGACIKEMQELKKNGFSEYLSPEFIYYHRSNKPASGMYGRDVFNILRKIGTVSEKAYRYEQQDNMSSRPSRKLLEMAAEHRIANYARIKTIDGLKNALIEFGPCYISLPLYKNRPEFWRKDGDEEGGDGHAVAVVGFNETGFIIRNSWGADWNGDGHIILPYFDWPLVWECWVGIDTDNIETMNMDSKKRCVIA